jgi:hypothetical protein
LDICDIQLQGRVIKASVDQLFCSLADLHICRAAQEISDFGLRADQPDIG